MPWARDCKEGRLGGSGRRAGGCAPALTPCSPRSRLVLQTHQLPSAPVRSPEGALSSETCSQLLCSESAHASTAPPGDLAPKTSCSCPPERSSSLPPSDPHVPGHVSIEVLTVIAGISLYQFAPPHPSQHAVLPLKGALGDEICVISVFSGLVGQGLPRAIVNTSCHLSY